MALGATGLEQFFSVHRITSGNGHFTETLRSRARGARAPGLLGFNDRPRFDWSRRLNDLFEHRCLNKEVGLVGPRPKHVYYV